MVHDPGGERIARQRRGFGVSASPFNVVKLELGVIAFGALLLLLLPASLFSGRLAQLLVLLGYGLVGFGWVVWRTRRVGGDVRRETHEP